MNLMSLQNIPTDVIPFTLYAPGMCVLCVQPNQTYPTYFHKIFFVMPGRGKNTAHARTRAESTHWYVTYGEQRQRKQKNQMRQ